MHVSFGTWNDGTADVAQRLGFNWKFTIPGYDSKARLDIKRASRQGETVRREGYAGVVGWYSKDKRYSGRMTMGGVDLKMANERGELFAMRETAPLPVYTLSYNIRAKTYARWGYKSITVGGSNTTPHHWDSPQLDPDGHSKKGGDGHDQDLSMTS